MEDSQQDPLNRIEVRSHYVRKRNALAVRADFGPLYEDYYLHWMQHGISIPREADDLLKDALAALVLHLASRPQDETVAWTVNFQRPLLSLFVTGSTRPGNVTGRVWTQGVRVGEHGLFCAETRKENGRQHRSTVDFDAAAFFPALEMFYRKSEQRLARVFRHGPEDFLMLTAQPECDLDWLAGLDDAAARRLEQDEEITLLETRFYHFDCGCTAARIVSRLATLSAADRDHLFDESGSIRVDCPRCGAIFEIDKDMFDKLLREDGT